MLGMNLNAAKSRFFDSPIVKQAVDQTTRRVLSRFGAFVRTRARSSIRKRKGASQPGSPPSSHAGTLRRFLYFAFDVRRRSVIIGPAATNQVFFDGDGKPTSGTVPQVLEEGGEIQVLEWFRNGAWTRADLRSRRRLAERQTRLRKVKIAARPYMGPAFQAELPRADELWRNSVRAA
jgi:hypothetical protein